MQSKIIKILICFNLLHSLLILIYIRSIRTVIEKSRLDKCHYESFILKNGLKTLTILNEKTDKSACALAVRTGSYDDTIPGIAHFLEHMLFMGTEQYPCENEYRDFLSKHNGSSNAFTSSDITLFFFDIDPNFFVEALERFSHFFKTPLFLEGSVDREKKAVDSEYKDRLNNEADRIRQVVCTCFNDEYSRFSIGNNETLNVEGIRDKVMEFWKNNYSSDRMNLIIYHKENIKVKIYELFDDIKKITVIDKLKINHFKDFKPSVIRNECLNKIIKIVPKCEMREIKIGIELPVQREQFKNNPYGFIAFLLRKKCKDSLTNILKRKGFILEFNVNFCNTYTFTILELRLKLTELGFNKHLDILRIVYGYIATIDIEEDEYNKIRDLNKWKFKILENVQPYDLVTDLAENMFYYPIENLHNNDFLFEQYDYEQIKYILDIISNPKNWLVGLIGKEFLEQGINFSTEKYFDVKYSIDPNTLPIFDNVLQQENDYGLYSYVYENKFEAPCSSISILLNTKVIPENISNLVII